MIETDFKHSVGLKWRIIMSVILLVFPLLCCIYAEDNCIYTSSGQKHDFVIGILSSRGDERSELFIKLFTEFSDSVMNSSEVESCLNTSILVLDVEEDLNIPTAGWTNIIAALDYGYETISGEKSNISVVVGPFYMNLALMLENRAIPYVVTDYMGYNWTDINRVDDTIPWKYLLEVRPPIAEINSAIVDFFVDQMWESVVVIMPESPSENQICLDLAQQMTENKISPISYSLELGNTTSVRLNLVEVLRMIDLLDQRNIVICSPREDKYYLISLVFEVALNFGMLEQPTVSFFALDPSTELRPFDEFNVYIYRLFTANCGLYAYRYSEVDVSYKVYDGFVQDVSEIIDAAKLIYLTEQTTAADKFSGKEYAKALKDVNLPGRTGDIMFDESGSRVNYSLVLYNYGGGSNKLYKKVAIWRKSGTNLSSRLTMIDEEDDEETAYGVYDDVIKVAVVLAPPFAMYRQSHEFYKGNNQFEGFIVDLLEKLSVRLKFAYEIYVSPDNLYGTQDQSTGRWTGIIGEVQAWNATLGMGGIIITSDRKKAVDFSVGIMNTGVNILITKPEEVFNMFQFLTPFSLELWMAIIASTFGVSIIIYILDCRCHERQFTVASTLWYAVGNLLRKDCNITPNKTSHRILTVGFLFFVLITVSTYTANMAAFLTQKNIHEPLSTFKELAYRNDYRILLLEDSSDERFFRETDESIFKTLYNKLETTPNVTAGRKMVEEGLTAFINDYMINSYLEKKHCRTLMVGSPILLSEIGIVMRHEAPFKPKLNVELLRLMEEGYIRSLRKKWWDNMQNCDSNYVGRASKQVKFKIEHTAGVFIVGCFGMIVAAVLFLLKKCYVHSQGEAPARSDNNTDGAVIRQNHDQISDLFSNGKQSELVTYRI